LKARLEGHRERVSIQTFSAGLQSLVQVKIEETPSFCVIECRYPERPNMILFKNGKSDTK
jgi:hypothetical protein